MEIPDAEGLVLTGYGALIQEFNLSVTQHPIRSFIAQRGSRQTIISDGLKVEIYPKGYQPGESVYETLEFALKHEGINLSILSHLCRSIDTEQLRQGILRTPGGKYARKIWFLFEFLTDGKLDLPDPPITNYVPLLDPDEYYTWAGTRSRRHRVLDNLLGVRSFCPVVRRTPRLQGVSAAGLKDHVLRTLEMYPRELLERATSYLYAKETKTSFEIESVVPGIDRINRFVDLLKRAGNEDFLNTQRLIELQHAIVDTRFADDGYRREQNYVGQSVRLGSEIIYYVPPKPNDVSELMQGFLESARRLIDSDVDPIVCGALVSFGFVFIHPFTDGNGRLHRFLLHHVLSRRGFTPEAFIFPVSATMLRERAQYDAMLESVSKPLLDHVEYRLDAEGRMSVLNDTVDYYRYLDFTAVTEGLFQLVEKTIDIDLVEELEFLVRYDRAKTELQHIVDMPDRQIDLFIRLVVHNQGALSQKKRNAHFRMLDDDEVEAMQEVVASVFGEARDVSRSLSGGARD